MFGIAAYLCFLGLDGNSIKPEIIEPAATVSTIIKENQKVTTKSKDGLLLNGHFQNNESDTTIIIVHGYNANALSMDFSIKYFLKMDYNILTIDLRGHGLSEGERITLGNLEVYDIEAWIKYLDSIRPNQNIVLYGTSMGASTILNVNPNILNQQVETIIVDSSYTSIMHLIEYHFLNNAGLKHNALIPFVQFIADTFYQTNIQKGPIDQIDQITTPIFFIAGQADRFVPPSMTEKLYNEAKCPKGILLVEGAGHVEANSIDHYEYWHQINKFISEYCK